MNDDLVEKITVVLISLEEGDSMTPVNIAREIGGVKDDVEDTLARMNAAGTVWRGPTGRYAISRKGREGRGMPKAHEEPPSPTPSRSSFAPIEEPAKPVESEIHREHKKKPSKCQYCDRVLASEAFRLKHERTCLKNPKLLPEDDHEKTGVLRGEVVESAKQQSEDGQGIRVSRRTDTGTLEAIEAGLKLLRLPNMTSITLDLPEVRITISNRTSDKNKSIEEH